MACTDFINEAYKRLGEAKEDSFGDAVLAIENGEDYRAWLKGKLKEEENCSCLKTSRDERIGEILGILSEEEKEEIFGKDGPQI